MGERISRVSEKVTEKRKIAWFDSVTSGDSFPRLPEHPLKFMKYLQFAVIVFVLYFLGYVLGPTMTPWFVKKNAPEGALVREVSYEGWSRKINLAEYRGDVLPKTLKMTGRTSIPSATGPTEIQLSPGEEVTLLNRDGDLLIVAQTDRGGKGSVKPGETNIYEIIARMEFDKAVEARGGTIAKLDPKLAPVEARPKPTPMPEPKPLPEPEPVVVTPTPVPTPELEPEPTPVTTASLSDDQIVELMKKSIAGGAVKEFTMAQVKGWKANGEETIDGTAYQTGLAAYEAETIFGVRPVQAKALIKDGKVVRWVYAKSGMEIQ